MKKLVNQYKLLLIICFIIIPAISIATPDFGDGDDDDVQDVPFDGGVSLLVAAGIGYGMKKIYDKKKEDKDTAHIEK